MKKDLVKVINSEAKMSIIRELSKGQKTPTDLSRKLGKVKSTVVEHLDELVKLGLVAKSEESGRKWVFYYLTKEGYRILETRPKIYQLIFPSSVLTLLVGMFLLFRKQPMQKIYTMAETRTNVNILPFILIFIGLLGLIFYFLKVRKYE